MHQHRRPAASRGPDGGPLDAASGERRRLRVRARALEKGMSTMSTYASASALRKMASVTTALLCSAMFLQNAEAGVGRWFFSWGTTNGPDLQLVLTKNATCFLSGVAGNLSAGTIEGKGWRSEASVFEKDNFWMLRARGGGNKDGAAINNWVNAHAVCIFLAVNHKTNKTSVVDGGKAFLANVKPPLQCFLSGILGGSGNWTNNSDYVRVTEDGTKWHIEGISSFNPDKPWVSAICVDMPPGAQPSPAEYSVNDPSQKNFFIGNDIAGVACALTGVRGRFTAN